MKTISDLESALAELADQDDPSDLAESVIDGLCNPSDLPIDLRVAGLLRVAAINSDLIYRSSLRRDALNLVLERLTTTAPSILTKYNISERTMADKVCRVITNFEPDAMSDLEEILGYYEGVNRLKNFRSKFLQGIKSDIIKVTIIPFLDLEDKPTQTFERCLRIAVEYSNANLDEARDIFENSYTELNRIVSQFTTSSTKPGMLIKELLLNIRSDIKDHFEASPFSKQAKLSIESSGRKHPLHIPDHELLLPIKVHNVGKGIALDVEVLLTDATVGLIPIGLPSRIADIPPESMMIVEIPVKTDTKAINRNMIARCEFQLSWINADGSDKDIKIQIEIEAQNNIDWNELNYNPYTLEAVTDEESLMGRSQALEDIISTLVTPSMGSLYIYGQKRVGKTSVAKVALNRIEESSDIVCIYRDIGTIADPDPTRAVDKLVKSLVQDLREKIPLANTIEIDGTLSPLTAMLENLIKSKFKIIFALDEYDNLPIQLFGRTDMQQAFSVGLRSISNLEGVGIMLIGGERMNLIFKGAPSMHFNKFVPFHLDRLDRETHWAEFENLIKNPAKRYLDYTESSCSLIYEYTEGNPYYTKFLCNKIFKRATKRRDSYVGEREVRLALEELFTEINSTSFSHYWEDYILGEEQNQHQEITLKRKQYLLAFGRASNINYQATPDSIDKQGSLLNLDSSSTDRLSREYIERGIIRKNDQMLEPCIKIFGHWIANDGQKDVIASEVELNFAKNLELERANLLVSFEEIKHLVERWDTYKGTMLTPDRIRSYLQQFETPQNQRIIFKILKNLCFIGASEENRLLKNAFEELQGSLKERHNRWHMGQIRISYFGHEGKSSLAMARSFASANKFLRDDRGILAPEKLGDAMKTGVTDIVVCDDFVGTGATIKEGLTNYLDFLAPEQNLYIFVLAGMSDGIDRITNELYKEDKERIKISCLYEIDSKSSFFDLESKVFGSLEESHRARELLYDIGKNLQPDWPLGFGDCCALITFSRTIPNNSLPILWSESKKGDFKFQPLFPRL